MSDLPRTLEPEVMDTEEEARDYDAMDHGGVNARFCADLAVALGLAKTEHLSSSAAALRVLDLGTGTGLIPIELCRVLLQCTVVALDLAVTMVAAARQNVAAANLSARIDVVHGDAKAMKTQQTHWDVVMSNSVVHHIPDPKAFFAQAFSCLGPGGLLFIRDLARPKTAETAALLAQTYSPVASADDSTSEVREREIRQHGLLLASLHAALTADEVQGIVAALGIPARAVTMTSDRHWTLVYGKPLSGSQ
jgi:2-polyprenyl-3-methyl-5-hydroxy-6-metoxy-1,4-benzoquinol methylase